MKDQYINIAKSFLELNGYEIVSEKYSCYLGEIDLVAEKKDDGSLHFVTVFGFSSPKDSFPMERKLKPSDIEPMQDIAANWLAYKGKEYDVHIVFDDLYIKPTNSEKALIKHHVDVVNKTYSANYYNGYKQALDDLDEMVFKKLNHSDAIYREAMADVLVWLGILKTNNGILD